jgi:RNA polymerase sigma-70 factor (ECF subfamily)
VPLTPDAREHRFNRLYTEHYDPVRSYLWRRDPALCEDALAETFLVAWRRLDDIPIDARPWLIGVARNTRLNLRRAMRRRESLSKRLEATAVEEVAAEPGAACVQIRDALARLTETDREILLLSVWEELDRAGIARAIGCSKANVSVRLHRARRRFEAALAASTNDSSAHQTLLPGGASDGC